jgi:hypothetical protein
MMRQMKALLPPDSTPGTYFMAAFLLRLPADMIELDHIISQDFKECTRMAEYTEKLYARIRQLTLLPAADAGRARRTTGAAARRPTRGAAAGRPPGRTKTTATSVTITPPTANRRLSASLAASGSRETDQPPGTKRSQRLHDFFTG